MFWFPWFNEINYTRGCSPIHLRLGTLHFFWNWKQVKRAVKSSRRNRRTDNCLKMVKIFLRWRFNTIAVQHALYSVQPVHFDECCRHLKNKHLLYSGFLNQDFQSGFSWVLLNIQIFQGKTVLTAWRACKDVQQLLQNSHDMPWPKTF